MGSFFCFRLATAGMYPRAHDARNLYAAPHRPPTFSPAKRIGTPVTELALMISIARCFIPVLVDEAERLRKAQVARGAEFSGHPLRRARSLLPLLIPSLLYPPLNEPDRLALAMESRGYQPGLPRTYYHQRKFSQKGDLCAGFVTAVRDSAIY